MAPSLQSWGPEFLPNDFAFLLRATIPTAHAVCDPDADPASSKCLLGSGGAIDPNLGDNGVEQLTYFGDRPLQGRYVDLSDDLETVVQRV